MDSYQGLPLRVTMDLGVMAMKGYSTFPEPPELEPHHQLALCNTGTLVERWVLFPSNLWYHSVDWRFDSELNWYIHVSSIVTYLRKTACCFWSTVSKRDTQFEHSFFIDKCSCKMVNTLSHTTSVYDQPKRTCGVFCFFFEDNCRIWATSAFSIIYVCTTAFQVSIPSLNCCFKRSRFQVTPFKLLLCLNSIVFHQKAMFYHCTKFRFFHCFENLKQ